MNSVDPDPLSEHTHTIAEEFAKFASFSLLQAPDTLLSEMKLYALDTLGVMLAGSIAPSSAPLTQALLISGSSTQATVAGHGRVASLYDAALINGAFAHSLELDDDHRVAVLHPGTVVVPAALAACEASQATGRTFLRSLLGGYEIMCRLGMAFEGSQFLHGVHPTALFGVFGAAASAAIGMELDEPAFVRSMGIAGTQASGLTEWRADGSWIKRLHPGRAAHAGVLSARLSAEGFTGPATIFEGPGGFFQAFSYGKAVDRDALLHNLGKTHHALDTAIKPYPCCRFMHGAIDLAIAAYKQGLTAEQIKTVHIKLYETGVLTYHQTPKNAVDAQFNVPYGVASALSKGNVTLSDFTEMKVQDPTILHLCQRIQVSESAEYTAAYPEEYRVSLVVETYDQGTHEFFSECPSGDPQAEAYHNARHLLEKETEEKIQNLLEECGFGDRFEPLKQAVNNLLTAPDIAAVLSVLGPSKL